MDNGPRRRILGEGLRGGIVLLLVPAIVTVAAWLIGWRLPKEHTAAASGLIDAPPERVWDLLNDIAAQSTWRQTPMVIIRDRFNPATGEACWEEAWFLTKFLLCATNTGQTHRVIRTANLRNASRATPFAATWTIDLAPAAGNRTTVSIIERSSIERPLWRFLGAYVLRQHTAVAFYLATLQKEGAHHYPDGP